MVHVYILQSLKDNGYYIGICRDVSKRLDKHNHGGVSSTKRRKPFRVIFSEEFENYKMARVREKQIKSYKGGNEFRKIVS